MSYAAALDHLNAMAPELFTRPGQPRRKFSLDQIRVLLDALDNPQSRFPSVLIAGTNGKGSTAATLASILTEAGVRTGLYTSPHLERVNERIRIGRTLIGDDDFARHFFRVHDTAGELVQAGRLPQVPSFFECLTALAFLYFAEAGVDDRRARSRHGRPSRRHQRRQPFAFGHHRYLPGPHGVAWSHHRRDRPRKGRDSPPRRHPCHPSSAPRGQPGDRRRGRGARRARRQRRPLDASHGRFSRPGVPGRNPGIGCRTRLAPARRPPAPQRGPGRGSRG